jgi:hypothetical protein
MCRECELIDYPTAGWPWVPCAPRPVPRHERDSLSDEMGELRDSIEILNETVRGLRRERAPRPVSPPRPVTPERVEADMSQYANEVGP